MIIGNLINAFMRAEGPPPQTLGRFMMWSLRGSLPMLWLAGFFSAALGTLEVLTAFMLGLIIDSALATETSDYFANEWPLLLAFAMFFLVLRPALFGIAAASNAIVVAPNVNILSLSRLNRWVLGQTVTFFDDDFAGRIAQKQMQTSRAITDVVSETINVVFFASASLIGSALLLLTIDWRIALMLSLWLVVYILMIRWFMPRVRKRSAKRADERAMVTGQVVDTITNIKTVKLFAHDEYEDKAALNAMARFRLAALQFGYLSAGFRFSLMTLAGFLPVLMIGGTLILWTQGKSSPGDIAAAGAIAIRIAQMTGWVSFTLMGMYANVGEIENGMKTLTPRPKLVDADNASDLGDQASVTFANVDFAYGRENGGVNGINLTINVGEKLGVVGASGAGKSTLVALLLRLYDPEEGQVLVGDQDIAKVTQKSLRRQIGMVTQETAMFNRSARENILYGRPDATEDEMTGAAKRAEADEFIQDLMDHKGRSGYEAHLGERGVKLSGGQRQRIALARAILKDAPILVLDEATSALDSEVEAHIQTALNEVMQGKTVIAIAHRLSTIAKMDRIIVMDKGQIVEEGSHDELLAKNGLYSGFWNRQSGGFIGTEQAET